MTMHLQQGLSTINTRKTRKLPKMTKAKMAELEVRWRKHNKTCKRNNMHDFRYNTLNEYIQYCYGLQPKKDVRADRTHYRPQKSYAQQRIEEFNAKYPSASMTINSKGDGTGLNAEWQKEKLDISSSYTVAPAYNKGAYQVVPKNEVKHIGK